MTAYRIETETDADGNPSARIERDGSHEGQSLTIRILSKDAANEADVELRPVPGEEPSTTLDHAATALAGILGSDAHVHIGEDDIRSICSDAAATLVVMESVSPETIGATFQDRLSSLDIPGDIVTGALISITGPKDMKLSEALSIVNGVRKDLTDTAAIVWGLDLADTDAMTVTVLVATQPER